MISRHEIIDVDFLRLPLPSNAPDRNPRVALGVLIDVGRGKEAKNLGRGVQRLGLGNAEAQPADPAHEAPVEKVRPYRNCERCTNAPFNLHFYHPCLHKSRQVRVVVLHLSYEARQQCQQVGDLRGWIDDLAVKDGPDVPQVLVGDVNAYLDYEWPMDALSGTMPDLFAADKRRNPCASQVSYEEINRFKKKPERSNARACPRLIAR